MTEEKESAIIVFLPESLISLAYKHTKGSLSNRIATILRQDINKQLNFNKKHRIRRK